MEEDRRLEAEARYIAGTMTLVALSEETGISRHTLGRWCKKYKWQEKRQKAIRRAQKKAEKKAQTAAAGIHAKNFALLLEALPEMEAAARAAAKALRKAMEEEPLEITDGKYRTKNFLNMAEALERLANVRMTVNEIIPPADREKLELLRRKQELEEKKAELEQNTGGAEIVVQLSPEIEEMLREDDHPDDAGTEPTAEAASAEP